MSKPYYVTTPIYYINSDPHMGHAYTTILADVLARLHRYDGADVVFQTGTDEHGEKIAEAARKRDLTPQAFSDMMSAKFRDLWTRLGLEPTTFIRTTDAAHKAVVAAILNKVHDTGDIYFGHYDGLYCVGCERYRTEKELVDGKCPDHDQPPEKRSESNWFFKMDKYRPWLRQYILEHPDFIQPEGFRKETLALLEEPIGDLSISRPRDRVPWGVPIPWDDKHVTYVWFDALINYVSGLGWPDDPRFARYWPASVHLIAKDILKPHCVFWPTMLHAAGIEPFKAIKIHGYWLTDTGKMSKSRGNVVRPLDLAEKYGNDAFRYFLTRDMTFGRDSTFSEVALAERINSDLANDLGNLLHRTLGMVDRYHGGILHGGGEPGEREQALMAQVLGLAKVMREARESVKLSQAIEAVMEVVRATNRYIDFSEPWKLAKVNVDGQQLRTVLYTCAEVLRVTSVLLDPVMPSRMAELRRQLGLTAAPALLSDAERWGLTPPGTRVTEGVPLFPRVDLDALRAGLDAPAAAAAAAPPAEPKGPDKNMDTTTPLTPPLSPSSPSSPASPSPAPSPAPAPVPAKSPPLDATPAEITFDDFMKVKLLVAKILTCEKVAGADKLLKMTLDAGGPERPTVLAGLAPYYQPEQLVGRLALWVANLKPKTMRGVQSQGMLLAGDVAGGGVKLVDPPPDSTPGVRVR